MTSSIFENTKNVLFYSDACFGLNKNSYVAAMFLLCVQELKNIECIDYKFLLPGHTHMACDIDHAIIGKQKKKKITANIRHTRDWQNFVRLFRKK